mmetsp:Transcript_59261/g.139848  ORF Transcript_59261/g.139848 Transcript_59261/m.139848 type:complete len:517 (-) Transcript_59261:3941-5491(-)
MDVADFLELERAFQRDRVVQAAAEEERVFLAGEFLAPGDDLGLQRQHGLHRHRQVTQVLQVLGLGLVAEVAARLGQRQRQQEQADELGREGLGGGHADLGAGSRDVGQLALAHHRAGGHIANGQRVLHALRAGVLEGGDGVRRLAALADRDDEGLGVGHAVAVAVLAGDLHAGGDLGDALQPVLGGRARVVAGAAGQDQHLVHLLEDAVGAVAEEFRRDAGDGFERVGDGRGLLEDFLLHVVAVGAELGRAAVGVHGLDVALHRAVAAGGGVQAAQPVAAQLQVHHVAFFEVDDLVGHAGQGHGVGSNEVLALALAHAQHQRRALAGGHHAVRLVAAEHGHRVGALQARQGLLHGIQQVAAVEVVDQVGDDLGVGLAGEHIAAGLEFGAQFVVVLDDAVVHQGDAAHAGLAGTRPGREMRVGVVHRRRAVRGPAGVGDAGAGADAVLLGLGLQLGHAGGAARPAQAAILMHGDAAGVISAVLQPLQAFDQDGNDIALTDRADDAAHGDSPLRDAAS